MKPCETYRPRPDPEWARRWEGTEADVAFRHACFFASPNDSRYSDCVCGATWRQHLRLYSPEVLARLAP